jgi:adenylosuccinate synthase
VRLGDLLRPDYLRARLAPALERKNLTLDHYGHPPVKLDELMDQARAWAHALAPRIVDTLPIIREAVRGGRDILLEGQLGVMRDLDWGIYPYVTSSNPVAGAAAVGAGMPPSAINNVIGVVKAYSTAVGAGPLPVELHDVDGEKLRTVGNEYGATTGRPRRCGWFDGVAIPYAAWLNGFTGLAITKLDVLDGFAELKICSSYRLPDGQLVEHVPVPALLEQVTPVYETWPGWQRSTQEARTWSELPAAARAYLHRISDLAGVPIQYVSVGPEREQLIVVARE